MARVNGTTATAEVEPGISALRTVLTPRGYGFGVAATTGTIGAALAAGSAVFTLRLDPGSTRRAFIERVRVEYTTIVAYTTPVTAGRRLGIYRGSGAATAGGTSIAVAVAKHGIADTSECSVANGGDIRVATTAALTATGITWEATPLRELSLVHTGAAGAYRDVVWEFAGGSESQPIQLDPGQLIGIRNPAEMDAAGTWQIAVSVDWHEAPALDYTG